MRRAGFPSPYHISHIIFFLSAMFSFFFFPPSLIKTKKKKQKKLKAPTFFFFHCFVRFLKEETRGSICFCSSMMSLSGALRGGVSELSMRGFEKERESCKGLFCSLGRCSNVAGGSGFRSLWSFLVHLPHRPPTRSQTITMFFFFTDRLGTHALFL